MGSSKYTERTKSTLKADPPETIQTRSVVDEAYRAQKAVEQELQEALARFAEACDDEYLAQVVKHWDAVLAETEATYANSPSDPCYSIREVGEQIADELVEAGRIDNSDRFLAAAWLYDERGVVDYVVFRALEELGWTIQINMDNDLLSVWADRERNHNR